MAYIQQAGRPFTKHLVGVDPVTPETWIGNLTDTLFSVSQKDILPPV